MASPGNISNPLWRPGADLPCTPTATVTGARFVAISGNRQADGTYSIAPPAAAGRVLGVASHDCAVGGKVNVIAGAGVVTEVLTAGIIAAGAEVEVDAQGRVVTKDAGVAVGVAMTGAADATLAEIRLYG